MNMLAEISSMMKRLNKWRELGGKIGLREWNYKEGRVSTGVSFSRRILDGPVIRVAHSKNEVAVEMMRPWLSEISVAWHNLIPLRRNRTSKSNHSELHQRRAAVSG